MFTFEVRGNGFDPKRDCARTLTFTWGYLCYHHV
jgi:hypothetical protein